MAIGIGKLFAKRLHDAFDRSAGPDNVSKAVSVLQGKLDPAEASPQTHDWIRACYGLPSQTDCIMHAVDCLLGCHGVETLGDIDIRRGAPYLYCNTGESYCDTVIWDRRNARFIVACWADIAEKLESQD